MVSKIQEEKIRAEIILLVDLFLKYNESDIELSNRTGISSSTVGRRLTDKARILAYFPHNGEEVYNKIMAKRQENLRNGKIMGGQMTMINSMLGNSSDKNQYVKLRLDVFYSDHERQMKILCHLILTFRLKLPLVCELFQFSESEIKEELFQVSPNVNTGLIYLFYYDIPNQEEAKRNLLEFYSSYIRAKRMKDSETLQNLIKKITDYEVKDVLTKRKNGETLSDMDIYRLLNWQLKYVVSNKVVSSTFNLDRVNYQKRVKKILLNEWPELQKKYEDLADYNFGIYQNSGGAGRRGY